MRCEIVLGEGPKAKTHDLHRLAGFRRQPLGTGEIGRREGGKVIEVGGHVGLSVGRAPFLSLKGPEGAAVLGPARYRRRRPCDMPETLYIISLAD